MKRIQNWLMLTATIKPMAKTSETLRADPEQRIKDYEDALQFYMQLSGGCIDGILFLENSDADICRLEQVARKKNPHGIPVKFFRALADCDPELGKGHSELQLMDRAFESEVSDKPETFRFWKITGRLKILNIERLIATAPANFGVYIDMRLVPSYLQRFGADKWADTRIVGFTPSGYRRHFFGKKAIVGTQGGVSHTVELAIFPSLFDAWQMGDDISPRFKIQPVIAGICAGSLKDYSAFPSRLKDVIRRMARLFLPKLWL